MTSVSHVAVNAIMFDLKNAYERLRSDQSLDAHIRGMLSSGLMTKDDAEQMLARDYTEPKNVPARREQTLPTHRGLGSLPPASQPEVVVLDWGVSRQQMTPPPTGPRRARTTSPPRNRFG